MNTENKEKKRISIGAAGLGRLGKSTSNRSTGRSDGGRAAASPGKGKGKGKP